MGTRKATVLGTIGLAGLIGYCSLEEDESVQSDADTYDLLCDEKQGEQLNAAIDGIVSNRVNIARKVQQNCIEDVRQCPPSSFNVLHLDRELLTQYPFICFGDTHDLGQAGAMTIFDEAGHVMAIGFTPAALDPKKSTSCALSGMIAHEFGHSLTGESLGHTDVDLQINSVNAPIDWIYSLGRATESVCDTEATRDTVEGRYMSALQAKPVNPDLISRRELELKVWEGDIVYAKKELHCDTANTMHMHHVCEILQQRVEIIAQALTAYETARLGDSYSSK